MTTATNSTTNHLDESTGKFDHRFQVDVTLAVTIQADSKEQAFLRLKEYLYTHMEGTDLDGENGGVEPRIYSDPDDAVDSEKTELTMVSLNEDHPEYFADEHPENPAAETPVLPVVPIVNPPVFADESNRSDMIHITPRAVDPTTWDWLGNQAALNIKAHQEQKCQDGLVASVAANHDGLYLYVHEDFDETYPEDYVLILEYAINANVSWILMSDENDSEIPKGLGSYYRAWGDLAITDKGQTWSEENQIWVTNR
jgi:hypothetical protein